MKMNFIKLSIVATALFYVIACGTSRKKGVSLPVPLPQTDSFKVENVKPLNGVYEPGDEELNAIKVRYSTATIEQLKEGHLLYTKGACINCHGVMNIYKRDEVQWKYIIDDMSLKAKITPAQKDAVYKYVMAIKATQPKEIK